MTQDGDTLPVLPPRSRAARLSPPPPGRGSLLIPSASLPMYPRASSCHTGMDLPVVPENACICFKSPSSKNNNKFDFMEVVVLPRPLPQTLCFQNQRKQSLLGFFFFVFFFLFLYCVLGDTLKWPCYHFKKIVPVPFLKGTLEKPTSLLSWTLCLVLCASGEISHPPRPGLRWVIHFTGTLSPAKGSRHGRLINPPNKDHFCFPSIQHQAAFLPSQF